ncbi:uncharacterized protein EMH_0097110 [Eimeria mitis]|uniref:Uncharacterized protein n=1 Tax=Eimeria mitis TaxID=44415 RepID=U6KN36_9EIME|nr:uncharacterized protein EMH_0097110 [Eimeria mitis]CDJ36833.1 hypothetical protein EMH_0097110 [Eimeria mitis]
MNGRFFGGAQEGEEKEENSESDEEQGEQSSKCVSAFKDFISAVFPNTYPLFWLALPFAVCAVLAAASFGNNTEAEEEDLVVFARENQFNATSNDPDTQNTFVKQMSTRDLTFQGVVLLIFISLINTAAWLGSVSCVRSELYS